MENKKPTFKFKTNVPAKVLFQFSQPKTGTGQYGEWYLWGVQVGGVDYGMFASDGLQNRISQLGDLKGRLFEITKVETDDNKITWKIYDENGADITPPYSGSFKAPKAPQNAPQQATSDLEKRLDAAAKVFAEMSNQIKALEVRVGVLELEKQEKENEELKKIPY